ncbi:type II secretion system protein, partial [bacterium]|nr:type II secretion system protein [bacterium]
MKHKGFTILELLLTMSIMVMVMTMIQSALAISSKVCTGGRDRAQLFHGARLAMDEMLNAFANMEYASTGKYEFVASTGDVEGY